MWERISRRENFMMMRNHLLEVAKERGLMSNVPRRCGSTLAVVLLHPHEVVEALVDDFQRRGGSHQHLHLVHPHLQVKEAFRRNPLPSAKAGTQGKSNVPTRGRKSLESSRKVLKVSHSKPLMDLMGM